jgi:signal transduction histidine kinase
MTNPSLDAFLPAADIAEAALHALITQRCQRAYAHELRNSLQGIYTGFDVLTRMLDGKTSTKLPSDKAGAVVRKSIANHDQSLEQIRKHLTLQNDAPEAVRVDELLRSLTSFLNNDASSKQVRLDTRSEALVANARPSKIRLVLLGLITDGIDAMTDGGELVITTAVAAQNVVLELTMTRAQLPWPESAAEAGEGNWTVQTLHRLVQRDNGALEISGAGRMRRVRLSYCAATSPEPEATISVR